MDDKIGIVVSDSSIYHGNPDLESDRLLLRKLRLGDEADIFDWASDPEVSRYVTWNTYTSLNDATSFIRYTLDRYERDEAGEWGIISMESGKLIGSMGFIWVDSAQHCGQIGYVLSRKYWGQGLMTEAVRRLIRFGFEEMGLNRIEAVHLLPNTASGKVMEKVGMKPEGILRSKVFAKGRFHDVRMFAIIRSDPY